MGYKCVKSSNLTKIWVSHMDEDAFSKAAEDFHEKKITAEEAAKLLNEASRADYIPYDHSRTLLDQLNEILEDETVSVVTVCDNTPNPKLDGANTLLRWRKAVNIRKLDDRSIFYLAEQYNNSYKEEA